MHDRDRYRSTKLLRGELVDQIKNKSQKDWIKVCNKLGVTVSTEYGSGSHAAAYKDNCSPSRQECCIVTFINGTNQNIQRDLFKKLLTYGLSTGKYTEDDMWRALGVIK